MWWALSLVVALSLPGSVSAVCPCEREELCQHVQHEHEFEVSHFCTPVHLYSTSEARPGIQHSQQYCSDNLIKIL